MGREKHWTDNTLDERFGRVLATIPNEITAQQVDFIVEKTGVSPGARVLDACCGYGRHSIELARRGYDVVGIDCIESYLAEGRKRAAAEGVKVQFVPMDVRQLSFEPKFDLVINMWNSFGYFDDETNASIMRRFQASLVKGGKLYLDIVNRDWVVRNFAARGWWRVDRNMMVLEERSFDLATSVNHCTWRFVEDGRLSDAVVDIRVYSCHELHALLSECGFKQVETFGDLEGGPVTLESQAMQVAATRD